MNTALETNFAIPGDATFPLNQAFEPPRDRNEAEILRQYIGQMRQELAIRLLNRIYMDSNTPSKVRLSIVYSDRASLTMIIVVAQLYEEKVHGKGIVRGIRKVDCAVIRGLLSVPGLNYGAESLGALACLAVVIRDSSGHCSMMELPFNLQEGWLHCLKQSAGLQRLGLERSSQCSREAKVVHW